MPRKAAKRELIEPHQGDKRYVRRKAGKFTTSQDVREQVVKSGWPDKGQNRCEKRPRRSRRFETGNSYEPQKEGHQISSLMKPAPIITFCPNYFAARTHPAGPST